MKSLDHTTVESAAIYWGRCETCPWESHITYNTPSEAREACEKHEKKEHSW